MLVTNLVAKTRELLTRRQPRIIIGLTLAWFENHNIHAYIPYYNLRSQMMKIFEWETGRKMGELELYVFDKILDCLEQLGYGQWCACASSDNSVGSNLFTFFYLLRPIDLTVDQMLWQFKLRRGIEWLERRIASRKIIPGLLNNMITFKNRLKRCKRKLDYETFRSTFYQKAKPFQTEAKLFVRSMEHIARL